MLDALERTPAAWQGEVWRWLSSLVVQDGGVLGTASNLIFLGLLGGAAEQVVGRVAMTVCYLVAGLAGQVAGVLWPPVGAGFPVAVCGLAGIVARTLTEGCMPGSALALWIGALLATWVAASTPAGPIGELVVNRQNATGAIGLCGYECDGNFDWRTAEWVVRRGTWGMRPSIVRSNPTQ